MAGYAAPKTHTSITVIPPVVGDNDRNAYQEALLRLALAKTKNEDGSFDIVHGPKKISSGRAHIILAENSIENYIRPLVFDRQFALDEKLSYIEFPIYFGLLSYRVCFVSGYHSRLFSGAKRLEDILSLRHIMGTGWLDAQILRHNGFEVLESTNYSAIFRMVAMQRADLFCRGLHEVQNEYEANKRVSNLVLDKKIALHYPLPIYFFGSRENKDVLARLKRGILLAYKDGSLMHLWRKHYLQSIAFSKLSSRKIFYLENPGLKELNDGYSKYFYNMDSFLKD